MKEYGIKSKIKDFSSLGITVKEAHWNLTHSELIEEALKHNEGVLTSTGALMCDTGKFTGRSPQDRFIVKDKETENNVWWGNINKPFDPNKFDALLNKMTDFIKDKKVYVRDAFVGADKSHRLRVRVINTLAWHNLFAYNMFLRIEPYQCVDFDPNFVVLCVPEFKADPQVDGTRKSNFAIINFTKKMIIIGGTAYSGEMKKGVFSVLNYLLPLKENVLSMHCSTNMGIKERDTSVFFGLSGTGKTTLSADPKRLLIGDDEHGWTSSNVFNFEGGCYAKVIDLTEENEPDIYHAICYGAILENTRFKENTRDVDYENATVTENTRVSYPISHIRNALNPSIGGVPNNIFFLTCDAFGVLPPIQKLSKGQAMYHFISGYTSKVAGTEAGVVEPEPIFSSCFGAPFLPLSPIKYATMLGEKMDQHNVTVWLINTGWTGGAYGVGSRIKLKYTRAMISAALNGKLDKAGFRKHTIFGFEFPTSCPKVPGEMLSPRETWKDDDAFYRSANGLAQRFIDNFKKFEKDATPEILAGGPTITTERI